MQPQAPFSNHLCALRSIWDCGTKPQMAVFEHLHIKLKNIDVSVKLFPENCSGAKLGFGLQQQTSSLIVCVMNPSSVLTPECSPKISNSFTHTFSVDHVMHWVE
ncbi:hypothetical protein ILYODFUR_025680 [Ilyodon furcidens]|uniref:Uncharacterized protein n=1 Tax=Ilyodon furcidens TaxID=33524 RepID=A0ABV0VH50_9TELE